MAWWADDVELDEIPFGGRRGARARSGLETIPGHGRALGLYRGGSSVARTARNKAGIARSQTTMVVESALGTS